MRSGADDELSTVWCNKCFNASNQVELFLTDCGHLICPSCIESFGDQDTCVKCRSHTSCYIRISQCPDHLTHLFKPLSQLADEFATAIDFQCQQKDLYVSALVQEQAANQRAVQEVELLKAEIEQLKDQCQTLRAEQGRFRTNVTSLSHPYTLQRPRSTLESVTHQSSLPKTTPRPISAINNIHNPQAPTWLKSPAIARSSTTQPNRSSEPFFAVSQSHLRPSGQLSPRPMPGRLSQQHCLDRFLAPTTSSDIPIPSSTPRPVSRQRQLRLAYPYQHSGSRVYAGTHPIASKSRPTRVSNYFTSRDVSAASVRQAITHTASQSITPRPGVASDSRHRVESTRPSGRAAGPGMPPPSTVPIRPATRSLQHDAGFVPGACTRTGAGTSNRFSIGATHSASRLGGTGSAQGRMTPGQQQQHQLLRTISRASIRPSFLN